MSALPSRAIEWVQRRPWALRPEVLEDLMGILARHAMGQQVAESEVAMIVAARDARAAGPSIRSERTSADDGQAKGIGSVPGSAVSKQDLSEVQREIDMFGELFVDAIAAGRQMDRKRALGLADGRVYLGAQAKGAGLVDHVTTFDAFLSHIREQLAASDAAEEDIEEDEQEQHSVAVGAASSENEIMTVDQKSAAPEKEAATTTEQPQAAATPNAEQVRQDAVAAERARITAIQQQAVEGQEAIAAKLIAEGTDTDTAIRELAADLRDRYQSLNSAVSQQREPIEPAPNPEAQTGSTVPNGEVVIEKSSIEVSEADSPVGDDALVKEWNESSALRSEFQDFDTFKALRQGEAAQKQRPAFCAANKAGG